MARKGPAPKPGSKRWQAGHYENRLRNSHEAGRVVMPSDLVSDPVASAFWKKHAPTLTADERLRPSGVPAFAQACQLHSLIKRLEVEVEKTGLTIETKGMVRTNPLVSQLREARRDLLKLLCEFGMTAIAAAKMPAPAKPEESADEAYLKTFIG